MTKQDVFIYITFDDGPLNGTKNCYLLSKAMGIKSTFFMVGVHAENTRGRNLVTLIKESYPLTLIANHSYSHANEQYKKFYSNVENAEEDFKIAGRCLQITNKIIRLPGNSAWVTSKKIKVSNLVLPLSKKLHQEGFNIIGWDIEFKIDKQSNVPLNMVIDDCYLKIKKAISTTNSFTPNHIVILFHDWMFQNTQSITALSSFIKLLKSNDNWHFETVDNYPYLQ